MPRIVELVKHGLRGLVGGHPPEVGSVLVVSPHLDDAVFSVGATMACLSGLGVRVEVVTLFAGKPTGVLSGPARHFHDLCGHPYDGSAIVARRDEDRAALTILGARWAHGEFLDAVYRVQPDGALVCGHDQAMFAEDPPDEANLSGHLTDYVLSKCDGHRPDLILTCSAYGRHIDHRHALRASTAVAQQAGIPLLVWEDLPYAVGVSPEAIRPTEIHAQPDPASWNAKWQAIGAYTSQTRMFWPNSDWAMHLAGHANSRGSEGPVEVLWTTAEAPTCAGQCNSANGEVPLCVFST